MPIRDKPRAARCQLACAAALVALTINAMACAPTETLKPVVPVQGTVAFDGKPAVGALVVFHPIHDPVPNALDPRAVVEADGTFALSTHYARDGAPPGRYAVTIHDLRVNSAPGEGPPVPAAKRLPPRYAEPTQSKLQADVRPDSPNAFPVPLTR